MNPYEGEPTGLERYINNPEAIGQDFNDTPQPGPNLNEVVGLAVRIHSTLDFENGAPVFKTDALQVEHLEHIIVDLRNHSSGVSGSVRIGEKELPFTHYVHTPGHPNGDIQPKSRI